MYQGTHVQLTRKAGSGFRHRRLGNTVCTVAPTGQKKGVPWTRSIVARGLRMLLREEERRGALLKKLGPRHVVNLHAPVLAHRGKAVATLVKGDLPDVVRVDTREGMNALLCAHVPKLHLPVRRAGSEHAVGRRESRGKYPARVRGERVRHGARPHVDKREAGIVRAHAEQRRVGGEGERAHGHRAESTELVYALPASHIEDRNHAIHRRTRKVVAVG
mmetsp:Transcript_4517/g.11603  ORF Transcript_4517/g.11603 Transcript_4517/m.11603 type:complete len:218 (+) Transcript_4517:76-729(+)